MKKGASCPMNKHYFTEGNYPLRDLIEQYGKSLTNFAFTYVKDWSLAEDIMQEVFINVYTYEQLHEVTSIKSWLYTLTANKCKDYLRKNYIKKDILVGLRDYLFLKPNQNTPEHDVISTSKNKRIAAQILELPVKYREIIILYYYEELTVKEISNLLGQKESTVKSKLHRGRKLLRHKMEMDGSEWFE